jgi:hypothetical protein
MKSIIMMSLLFFFGSEKQLKDNPIKKGSIKISQKLNIVDPEGYYDRSIASMNKSYILVYDAGSKIAFTYDHNGKQLNSFGKEGNGPGEFDFIRDIYSHPDYMIFTSFRKSQLFDKNGKFIAVLANMPFNSIIEIKDKKIYAYVNSSEVRGKYSKVVYSLDGKLIESFENKDFKPNENGFRNINSDRIKDRLTSPRDITVYNDGYIQYHPGEYQLEILDKNFKSKMILKRAFKRVKEATNNNFGRFSNNNSEAAQKRRAQFMAVREGITGGFQSDIRNIIGSKNGYIFVQTASSEIDELHIDVISPDFEYIDKILIKKDEIQSAQIENDHLIVNFKNQENGPYVGIYTISF